MPDYNIESELMEKGYRFIAGVDEAGRGPLAGPVCAASVILPADFAIEGINDSKKISEKKRDRLFDEIIASSLAYGVALVDHKTIDEINIRNAAYLAMSRAIEQMDKKPDYVIVDGNDVKYIDEYPHECIIKGDAKSLSIAAASILAKVTRDRFMAELDEMFPQYGFAKHKGYPTKEHYAALKEYGPCPYHRMSFNLKL